MMKFKRSNQLSFIICLVLFICGFAASAISLIHGSSSIYDFLLNFGTELIGALITFLLIDRALNIWERKEDAQIEESSFKKRLLIEMGSSSNEKAIDAIDKLRARGWLFDNTLVHIYLVEANLTGCNLSNANLVNANFSNASLERARMMNAILAFSSFAGAKMNNCELRFAELTNTNLVSANLAKADLRNANLENANLMLCDISYAQLQGANLTNANMYNTIGIETAIFDETTILPTGEFWYSNIVWNTKIFSEKKN